jgi:hypothetical protein
VTTRLLRSILAPAALLFSAACVELDVNNPNNPDATQALSSPSDVENIASSSIHTWYMAASHYEPNMMLQVTADAATANFGNFGMRFNNEEPRIPYNNQSASGDELAARRPWRDHYGALGAANDALGAIDIGGIVPDGGVDGAERVRSAILWTQAATHTYIGLLFDKGFVITLPPDPVNLPTLRPYTEVLDSAMGLWDQLIALTAGKAWSWDADWMPVVNGPVTADMLNRYANTMAARTLVLGARNPTENAATDWAAVLAYADNGITGTGLTDMNIGIIDDYDIWWDYTKNYGNLDSWTRVDQRLINRMDPDIPAGFTGIANQPISTPNDNRLVVANLPCGSSLGACLTGITADYVDVRTVIGDPGRGIHKQSTFYHNRYRNSSFAVPASTNIGLEVIHVSAAENDLMIAEALARTNTDLPRAQALVDKYRVTRGGLAAVAGDVPSILAAIDYERDVELLNTGAVSLFDRRRLSAAMYNPGTWRHLPLPARELEVLQLPIYTFGGVGLPDM